MVKAYFTACEQAFPAQRAQLRRLSLALRRGGVERMEQLCAMQRAGPEGLLELRSIGEKSLPLIAAVCARYEENRTPSQGGTPLRETGDLSPAGMPSCPNKRRKFMKKRLLSILCVLALCLTLLPATALAADGDKTIMLGTSGIKDPTPTTTDNGTYYTPSSYIYFGVNGSAPIKWRVLNADTANDNSTAGVFLLSEHLLAGSVYFQQSYHNEGKDLSTQSHKGSAPPDDDHTNCLIANAWQGSDAQEWCKTFASNSSNFSAAEQSAMLGIEKTDSVENGIYHLNWGESSLTAGDKMFFLSAWELANYVGDYDYAPGLIAQFAGGGADYWWLRSPIAERSLIAGLVDSDGKAYYTNVKNAKAVRPAFNLDLSSVLFTSAAVGGKSATGMDSGLTAVGAYDGSEWKLTLLDKDRNFAVTEKTVSGKPSDTITLKYTGATTGTNEYISVLLTDQQDNVLYYGRVVQATIEAAAEGEISLIIPDTLAEGTYTLNVFSEQYNGDYKTDYASAFAKVTLTVDETAPTLGNGSATRDSETDATVKFTSSEAGTCYYIAQDTEITLTNEQIAAQGMQQTCNAGENEAKLNNITTTTSAWYMAVVVKDAAGNVSDILSITIPAPTYIISAEPTQLNFESKADGYTEPPAAQTVTITNTGNQRVTVDLPASTNYTITAGEGFETTSAVLAPNGTATFTVQPVTGLGVGTYGETLSISGSNNTSAEVSLAFTVEPKSLEGAQVNVTGDYTYDGNEKKPSGSAVTVTLNDETLTEGSDYTLSYENNTDAGEATVKVSGTGNYSGTVTGTFQIAKATPTVSDVAVSSPATIYASTDISAITLTHGADDTPGTVKLDDGQTLSVGEGTYNWTFTPTDTTNYTTATGSITLTVAVDTVQSITVFTAPTKTTYTYGDSFDKTGMEVTATYASGETKDVTEDVTITPTELTVDVTTVTISYGGQTTTQGITVNPKEISITSATVQDKTYDGGTDATVGTVTFTGLVNGESLTSGTDYTATAAFTDKNAGDSKQATVTVELKNGNYTFANSEKTATANATAKISPLAVALSWSTPTSFTYDGTEKSVTASITNAVSGDDVSVAYDSNSTTKATAANEYTATASGLSGNDANNYTLTGADNLSQSWSIGGASIAGATVELSGTAFTYNGQSQKPTVTVKLNGNTLNANTDYTVDFGGDSINAGTYTVTVTGTGNYSGTATSKPTYTIHKAAQAALTITSTSDATYGQDYTLTTSGGSGSGAVTITVSNGTGAATVSGYTLTPTKAGTVTVTAVKAGDNNYNDGTSVSATITINKGTYDGTTTATGSVLANWPGEVELPGLPDGASYGEPSSNDVTGMSITGGVLHYTGGSGIVKDQTYTVTVPVAGATNYNDYQITVTLTGTDKQVLTITGVTAQNGTYNGQTQAGYTGTPSAQGYTGDFTVTYNTEDGKAPTNAGTYSVTIAIPDTDPQYVGSIVLEFTIAKKALTVSAPSASVYVGDNAPLLALTYTGLVDGESVTPSEAPVFTITKSDGTVIALDEAVKTAGTYTITWSNADSTTFPDGANYAIQTETTGTLTVSPRSTGGSGVTTSLVDVEDAADGEVKSSHSRASQGTTVTLIVIPDEGYELASLTITKSSGEGVKFTDKGNGKFTFTMPSGNVTVEAVFTEITPAPLPFTDVAENAWYAEAVRYVYEHGLMTGTSATTFAPNATTSRSMIATILWRMAGSPVVNYAMDYADVAQGQWYSEAIRWAASEGIVGGYGNGLFGTNDPITREQLVTMLYRYAQAKGYDTTQGGMAIREYADFEQISGYAVEAMTWAVNTGIINGTSSTTLSPQGAATRAQVATILMRFIEGMA